MARAVCGAMLVLVLVALMTLAPGSEAAASKKYWERPLPPLHDGARSTMGGLRRDKCSTKDCETWIVKFKEQAISKSPEILEEFCVEAADSIAEAKGDKVLNRFSGKCLRRIKRFGFIKFSATEWQIRQVRKAYRDELEYVERDLTVKALRETDVWGLDRIDQRQLPLDDTYMLADNVDGSGVHVYILDTGIQSNHTEFEGRMGEGYDFVSDDDEPEDCDGHGTHCAGSAAGATFGSAPGATLHGVRVLDCFGSGSYADIIAGMEWVADNHDIMHPGTPAVASMSLGGGYSAALNDAVSMLVNSGVTVVVAAGNSNADACSTSPAAAPLAITVGATNDSDGRATFSNYGECLDLFAPGVDVESAWIGEGVDGTNTISGTSMATPYVAGAVALYLQVDPTATVDTITRTLLSDSTTSVVSNPGSLSPNKLLFTGQIEHCEPNENEPVIDCTVSEWSDWSECDATCGGGLQTRTRTVVSEAQNCGLCNFARVERRACNADACGALHEFFSNAGRSFDLEGKQMTFSPNEEATGYDTCSAPFTDFPVDPDSDGESVSISLGDDDSKEVEFSFAYLGKQYTSVFVGSNGYISLGSSDTGFQPHSPARKPRIAGTFTDLYPAGPESVKVNIINDSAGEPVSLAVTYNLKTYANRNSDDDSLNIKSQIVLYADSGDVVVSVSNLASGIGTSSVLVGLMSGGTDVDDVDLSASDTCPGVVLPSPPSASPPSPSPPPPSPPPPSPPPPSPPPPSPPPPSPPPPSPPPPPPPKEEEGPWPGKRRPPDSVMRNFFLTLDKLTTFYKLKSQK